MLDIHVAATKNEEVYSHPFCAIDVHLHERLFKGHAQISKEYPTLNRMSDYFSDCKYSDSEIQDLAGEISRFLSNVQKNEALHEFLRRVLDACPLARKEDKSLFVFCD